MRLEDMLVISKTSVHATLALVYLAQIDKDSYVGASQIAENINAPKNYLGKLLNRLAAEGLLESIKGFGGGFRLAKQSSKISIFNIVEPIDSISKLKGCFLGQTTCSCDKTCVVHNKWDKIRSDYLHFLKTTTIKDIVEKDISLKIES